MGFLSNIMPAIGGLLGIGQGALEARTAKRNTDATIAANQKMAEYQYSKDLEMWNKANEYNSPASQMSRYTSAGLNPNLIYGTGTSSSGNTATSLPKYQAPTVKYDYKPSVDLGMVLNMYQDFRLKQAQTDNLVEQKRILTSEADMKFLESLAYGSQTGIHDKTNQLSSLPLLKRQNQINILRRTQADADRVNTDAQIRALQLMWMRKLGVTGLGGIVNALGSAVKIIR